MKSAENSSTRDVVTRSSLAALLVGAIALVFAPLDMASAADVDALLEKLRAESGETRREAWSSASEYGAEAVRPLVRLASSADKDAALAASRALKKLAHAHAAPGSETRRDVASALAAALGEKEAAIDAKRLVLELLGSMGGEECVSAVAGELTDSRLRDAARRALERIPGEAATRALVRALRGSAGPFQESIIATLGTRGDPTAARALTEQLGRGPSRARIAAARALTRIGGPETILPIAETISLGSDRERSYLVDDLLRMGDRFKAEGRADVANRIYAGVFEKSAVETLRYAALYALCREKPRQHVSTLLEALDGDSAMVRQLAMELLVGAEGREVDGALLATYGSSSGARKAALLRVLHAREIDGADELVENALEDTGVDVKVTALELSGRLLGPAEDRSDIEAFLVEAAKTGSPEVRATALSAYLERANQRAAGVAGVSEMYKTVFDLSADKATKGAALVGLAKVGHPNVQKLIARASEDPELLPAAATARVYRARLTGLFGSKEVALDELIDVITSGTGGREAKQLAVEVVRELGGDVTLAQKAQGLITEWWVIGPFPSTGGKGAFDTVYSPEEGIHLTEQIDHKGRKRKWRAYETLAENGMVDFEKIFRRTDNVLAYAYTELETAEAKDIQLRIGSDDGIKVFLNGEQIHANNATRPFTQDQDVVNARLNKGTNRLLLKITQGGGEWSFAVRITDREGRPINVKTLEG